MAEFLPVLARRCLLALVLLVVSQICLATQAQADAREDMVKSLRENTLARTTEYYEKRFAVPTGKAVIIEAHLKELAAHPGFLDAVVQRLGQAQSAKAGEDGSAGDPGTIEEDDVKSELYILGLRRVGLDDLRLCVETNIRLAQLMTPEQYRVYQLRGLVAENTEDDMLDAGMLVYQKFETAELKRYLDHLARVIFAELDKKEPVRQVAEKDAEQVSRDLFTALQVRLEGLPASDNSRLRQAFVNLPQASAVDARDVLVLMYKAMLDVPVERQENVLRFFITDADQTR